MLDHPQYSLDRFVDRARAQIRDRNHFGSHRIREIRRPGRGVRRSQGYCVGLFHSIEDCQVTGSRQVGNVATGVCNRLLKTLF
jgi:hypothetical protein